jgi:hypothetical protein
MDNPEVTVSDLRARAAFADEELRKLVDKVDPEIKEKAKEEAEEIEAEEADAIQAEEELEEELDTDKSGDTVEDSYDSEGRKKYISGKTQPRDARGKFRLVLARLKQDLGTSGNQAVVEKIKEAENLDNAGNYAGAVQASSDLISTIDRLDSGALNAKSVENVRVATSELGKVISNLPLPFENQAVKLRFSDLPASLKDLTENLIEKVEQKIGKEDADEATAELRGFMSGSDYFSQAEVSAQLNRMLRLLT